MTGLGEKDLRILESYSSEGNRELYFNYLAHLPGNDGYALLALGVVRDDNMDSAAASMLKRRTPLSPALAQERLRQDQTQLEAQAAVRAM